MSHIALQVERLASGLIMVGSPVVFDTIVYTDGNISYNAATGVITFNEPGRYIVDWWVAAQAAVSPTGLIFAILTSQGDFLKGNTSDKMGEDFGIGIVDVAAPPVTMRLINIATGNAALADSLPQKVTLRVVRDDITLGVTEPVEATGITAPAIGVDITGKTSPSIKDVAPILNPGGIGNEPYALILDTNTQTPGTADTATPITLSTNQVLNSISHTAGSGVITFQTAGIYLVTVSAQVSQTVAQSTFINLWLRKNGGDLTNSNRSRTLTSATDFGSLAFSYIVSMANTNTLEIYQAVSAAGRNTGIYVRTPGVGPVSPSIIISIDYISI